MQLPAKKDPFLYQVIYFRYETGCIPRDSICYCEIKTGQFYWVQFKNPILGMYQIKLHEDVIQNHGVIVK